MASRSASRTVMRTVLPFHSGSGAGGGEDGAGGAAFFSSEGRAAVGDSSGLGSGRCAAAGFDFAASATLSPSAASTRIGVLTATPSVPSGTRICATVPSSTASTSIVALSVSISQSTSPDFTASPTLTCHLASLPSVMVGERAGIRTEIDIDQAPTSTSVQSSEGSGSGLCWAYSAASLTILRISPSIALSAASSAILASSSSLRTWSIGSRSLRYLSTSSLERYLAGSLIEWPR